MEMKISKKKVIYTDIYARVCGYVRCIKKWNAGKQDVWSLRNLIPRNEVSV